MSSFSFTASQTVESFFINSSSGTQIFVVVYVDEILVSGSDSNQVELMISKLSDMFSIKDLGFLDFFLGNSSAQDRLWSSSVPKQVH